MPRMTHSALLVLRALTVAPGREMYGLEIMRAISLPSGTVYPLLDRAEAAGWVTGREEAIDPKAEGRPRRKYYRATPEGEAAARTEMEREAGLLAALGVTEAPPETGPLRISGTEIPILADDRQPPGIISVVSAGLDVDGKPAVSVAHVDIGADEPEPGPCVHRIPPGSYCTRCERLIGGLRLDYGLSPAAAPQPAAHLPQAAVPVLLGRPAPEPGRRRAVLGLSAGCRLACP